MRLITGRRLIVSLFTFIIGVTVSAAWYFLYRSPISINTPASIPSGWRRQNFADDFSFYIPPDMKESYREIYLHGSSHAIWEYRGSSMYLEVGPIAAPPDLSLFVNKSDYREEIVEINGRRAKICTYKKNFRASACTLSEVVPYSSPEVGWKYVASVYFLDVDDLRHSFSLWVSCEGPHEQEVAKQIFRTIEFR